MKCINLLGTTLLFVTLNSYATTTDIIKKDTKSTYNEVDDSYNDKSGFAFYEDRNTSLQKHKKSKPNMKCNCQEIMKKVDSILDENKKQTKIQENILKLLQKAIDPQPEKIIVDGKECIANSSDKCFKMPIIAEAAKIPVLKAWMENSTLENTKKFLKWEAKYFKEVFKRGDSLPLALSKFGAEAYPMQSLNNGYIDLFGFSPMEKAKEQIVKASLKDMKIVIFFGMNPDLDLVSIVLLKDLLKTYNQTTFNIVFTTKKAKALFDATLNGIYGKKAANEYFKNSKMIINTSLAKKYDIFTTPSVVIKDKENIQNIYNGKLGVSSFNRAVYRYLEFNNKLDHKKLFNYKAWDKNTNFSNKFFGNKYHVNIDQILKNQGVSK